MAEFQGIWAVLGILALAWICSEQRRAISLPTLLYGLAAQILIALLVLKFESARLAFVVMGKGVDALSSATLAGTGFVFGYVGGGAAPFAVSHPENGFALAFQALPVVIVITALSAVLYHWRVLPTLIKLAAHPLRRLFGLGGAVGMSAAAMPLLGMVESPLLIRPYIATLSRQELMILMSGGMSTIAGSVMVLYAGFLKDIIADPIGHLITSALMGIPMAIALAKTLCPQKAATGIQDQTLGARYGGTVDAIIQGTMDGVRIVVGIVAVLIVTVALVHLINSGLGLLPGSVTLQQVAGLIFRPVAWAMGVSQGDSALAGILLGEKVVLNELLAFSHLAHLPLDQLTAHTRLILIYGLCSFSNFGSLGILVGGLAVMAPERRAEIIALGPKALLAGTMTSCLNGAVAGMIAG